jgi:hypothetical protein
MMKSRKRKGERRERERRGHSLYDEEQEVGDILEEVVWQCCEDAWDCGREGQGGVEGLGGDEGEQELGGRAVEFHAAP